MLGMVTAQGGSSVSQSFRKVHTQQDNHRRLLSNIRGRTWPLGFGWIQPLGNIAKGLISKERDVFPLRF